MRSQHKIFAGRGRVQVHPSTAETWIDDGRQMAEHEGEQALESIDLKYNAEVANFGSLVQEITTRGRLAYERRDRLEKTLAAAGFDPARHARDLAQGRLHLIWAIALLVLNAVLAVFVLLGFGPIWLTLPLALLVLVAAVPVEEFFQAYDEKNALREGIFLTLALLALGAQFWLGTIRGLFLTALAPEATGPVTAALAAAGPILRIGLGILAAVSELLCGYSLYRARALLYSATARGLQERDRIDEDLVALQAALNAAEAEPDIRRAYRQIGARQRLAEQPETVPPDENGHLKRAVVGAIIGLTVLFILLVAVSAAFGQTGDARSNTVVMLDLTKSTSPTAFRANVEAVSPILTGLTLGQRAIVMGIGDDVGQAQVLFDQKLPTRSGYLGLELRAAQEKLLADWRNTAAKLRPTYMSTDVVGGLVFLSYLSDVSLAETRLIILSDLRQSRHVNLEAVPAIKVPVALAQLSRTHNIPDLKGLEVYLLGVDPADKSAAYLSSLKAFWIQYFTDAGAAVRMFSVGRQLLIF
jgi:hypothetical protein